MWFFNIVLVNPDYIFANQPAWFKMAYEFSVVIVLQVLMFWIDWLLSLKSQLWPQRTWGFSAMTDHWKVVLEDHDQNYWAAKLQARVGLRSEVILYIKAVKIALCGPVIVVPVW